MALISNGDQVLTKRVYNSDETVLWEGEASTGTITLSEPLTNFERVKFYMLPDKMFGGEQSSNSSYYSSTCWKVYDDGNTNYYQISLTLDATGTVFTIGASLHRYSVKTTDTWNHDNNNYPITKIVGINRKQTVTQEGV